MKLKHGMLYVVLGVGAGAAGFAFLAFLAAFVVSAVAAFWPVA